MFRRILIWIDRIICDGFGDIRATLLDNETIEVNYGIVIGSVVFSVIPVHTKIMQPNSKHGLKCWYYVQERRGDTGMDEMY
jgi:hypothetical protein